MAVELNHTIVQCRDQWASATFLADLLGLAAPTTSDHFTVVRMANNVTLDFMSVRGEVVPQHYAFLLSDREFDEVRDRITDRGMRYWAGPGHRGPGMVNHWGGGRGLYFDDLDGHAMEIMVRPEVSAGQATD